MLFSRLKNHTERLVRTVDCGRHANESTWNLPQKILSSATNYSKSRASKIHLGWNRLPFRNNNVRAVFARRLESAERNRVEPNDRESSFLMTQRRDSRNICVQRSEKRRDFTIDCRRLTIKS